MDGHMQVEDMTAPSNQPASLDTATTHQCDAYVQSAFLSAYYRSPWLDTDLLTTRTIRTTTRPSTRTTAAVDTTSHRAHLPVTRFRGSANRPRSSASVPSVR